MTVFGHRVQERVRRACGRVVEGKFDEGKYVLLILLLHKSHLTSGFFFKAHSYAYV